MKSLLIVDIFLTMRIMDKKGINMEWSYYLTDKSEIARQLRVSRQTIYNWVKLNRVNPQLFLRLQSVLASLGHELTPTEMRKLNDKPR